MKYIARVYYEDGRYASEIVIDASFDRIHGRKIKDRSDAITYMKTYILNSNQYCIVGAQ